MTIRHHPRALAALVGALITVQAFSSAACGTAADAKLGVKGRGFVDASGKPFTWLGITAFALLDQVADGREQDAVAFLRWARGRGFTLVRVLGMAHNLFELSPEAGVRALPRLLELTEAEGLALELVLFADTRRFPGLDYQAHVAAVARAAGGARNLVLELANENSHHTQDPRLADPAFLAGLRERLPKAFAVSMGSLHGGDVAIDRYPGGDYVTLHVGRSGQPWDNVTRVAEVAALSERFGLPIVSDEPIGAGERDEPGRRLSDPAVFFGLGVLGRMAAVPTTFHCEDCLYARPPGKTQDASATAFIEGSRLLPGSLGLSLHGRHSKADGGPLSRSPVQGVRSLHVAIDSTGSEVFVAAVGVSPGAAIAWRDGWSIERLGGREGISLFEASARR
ncbi:MAG: hypothetical protein EHM13_07130 [Acidobacteria bacterium]|nr:MAG: hypothetical protein EHM13_07130 [Acidobacteriota bacterium]